MSDEQDMDLQNLKPEETEQSISVPAGVLTLLDKLNTEAKIRAEVEKQSLVVTNKQNEMNFEYEKERLKVQSEIFQRDQHRTLMVTKALIAGSVIFFGALCYFAYMGNSQIVKDVFYPLLIAIISGLGGYGFGKHKSDKEKVQNG